MKAYNKLISVLLAAACITFAFSGCNGTGDTTDTTAHVHNYKKTTVTEGTCNTKGTYTYTCSCGESYTEEVYGGHVYEVVEADYVAPTDFTAGSTTVKCTFCGEEVTKVLEQLFSLYETPVDCTTLEAATEESTYVYFGVFPQTVYSGDSSDIASESAYTAGGFDYYKGPNNSDGTPAYYVKATENTLNTNYTYSDGSNVKSSSDSSTRYFKVEPIKWKVLTTNYNGTGNALLLAENILTASVKYNDYTSNRIIGQSTVYANNYKYSTIRAYLNGSYESDDTQTATYTGKGFLQSAFTTAAQSLINTTTVDNSAASTTDTAGNLTQATSYYSEDTEDKIFLLSEKEATTSSYGFEGCYSNGSGNARIRVTTDYAMANYATQDSLGYGDWWLRSPYRYSSSDALFVGNDGYACYDSYVSNAWIGVVPALSISLQ